KRKQRDEEYDMTPMPASSYVPGVAGPAMAVGDGAHIWQAGDDVSEVFVNAADQPFEPGCRAAGFLHSGHLNRLYAWLDVIIRYS
ncbi:hypothetical protein EV180_005519, partial [Coemansia sp. RSA 518]